MEWRALTVCLLDEVAEALRRKLGKSQDEFPLVKVCISDSSVSAYVSAYVELGAS